MTHPNSGAYNTKYINYTDRKTFTLSGYGNISKRQPVST